MTRKIFIVDDDANIIYGLQAKLRVAGNEVAVSPGNEGDEIILEKIKSFKPDFLILDLMLPVADGIKILTLIKSARGLPELPVFVYSNLTDKESREKSLNLGASQYLVKSQLNHDELIEKINKILDNKEIMKSHKN